MEFVFRLIKDILPFQKEHHHHHQQVYTIHALIQYWPLVLSITDKNGNLLLHHACNKGQYPIGIMQSMIETSLQHNLHYHAIQEENNHIEDDPKGCNTKYYYHGGLLTLNRQHRTPLQNLCRILTDDNVQNNHNNRRTLDKVLRCHKLCPNIPILHAAITSVKTPTCFQMLLTTLEKNGIINHKNNGYYNYWSLWKDHSHKSLIEVAIQYIIKNNHSKTTTTTTSTTLHNEPKVKQQCRDIIQIIIESKPLSSNNKSLSFVHSKDDNGRLPLHYACELGLSWDDGLKDILCANKNAVQKIDGKTSLYPFMLSAVSLEPNNDLEDCSRDRKECDINVIYQLLRKQPNIINNMTTSNQAK